MSGEYQNYFNILQGSEDASSLPIPQPREEEEPDPFKNDMALNRFFVINSHMTEDIVARMEGGLKQNTSIVRITMCYFEPNILKACTAGLRNNITTRQLCIAAPPRLHSDPTQQLTPIPQECLPYLEEMLTIPTLRISIDRLHDPSILEILTKSNLKNVQTLSISGTSTQLDEVLFALKDNTIITEIDFDRKDVETKCNNFAFFGNFKQLEKLKLNIREDEAEEFFEALKHHDMQLNLRVTTDPSKPSKGNHYTKIKCKLTVQLTICVAKDRPFNTLHKILLANKSVKALELQDIKFDKLDLGNTSEKIKLEQMATEEFNIKMAKTFEPKIIQIRGTNFEGLKIAKIGRLVLHTETDAQQIVHLFSLLNANKHIHSILFYNPQATDTLSIEFCNQLKRNKTLKMVDVTYMPFSTEVSLQALCEMIETNNTIEAFIHDGTFGAVSLFLNFARISSRPLLEALKKNTTLKRVNFYRLDCKDWEVEDVLKVNKFLVFDELADRTSGSRASKLNRRNRQNQERRTGGIKCNVMSLARSHMARTLPIELWELILDELKEPNFDHFDLFKSSLRNK